MIIIDVNITASTLRVATTVHVEKDTDYPVMKKIVKVPI